MTLDDVCKNDDGEAYSIPDPKGGVDALGRPNKQIDATVRVLLANGVATLVQKEAELDAEKKYERGKLARKIRKGRGQTTFSIEELGMIKESVGKFYTPELVNILWDFLEDELKPQTKEKEALDKLEASEKKGEPKKVAVT